MELQIGQVKVSVKDDIKIRFPIAGFDVQVDVQKIKKALTDEPAAFGKINISLTKITGDLPF